MTAENTTVWDGTPPAEYAAAFLHLLSDRGEPPLPARFDPETGVWWVRPGVPFPISDMHSCGFRYVAPMEITNGDRA